ncbi:MAG: hypothetical protein N2484_03510 [Clostridia bacterium]|nr:hypothetical protein [Clostridia bacterium]
MNQFYVSIIFLGITLITIALVWIAYDIKRSNDYEKRLDEKKKDLVEIISDSEQMIEELNKFSDYIVTQMDIKNEEMNSNLKVVEERIRYLQAKVAEHNEIRLVQSEKVVNGSPFEIRTKAEYHDFVYRNDLVIDTLETEITPVMMLTNSKPQARVRDNVIPLNSRHKEVLRLSESGMSDTEIAKTLNMGKGEIQLILGVNR